MKTQKRIILIFPGQGSQYVGMGKDLYDRFQLVRDIYGEASRVLGYDMAELCFEKHMFSKFTHRPDINKTLYTQPAVLTTSYACYRVLVETCKERQVELNPFLLAGHSLGEYTALLVAEAMDFETVLSLVHKRAELMTEWGTSYPGAGLMAVVKKGKEIDNARICALCKEYGVFITLNNTPSQIVVGGSKKRLAEMGDVLKKEGVLSTMLKVEGPFHTPIMKPAADKFKKHLERCDMQIASKPVLANVTTEALVDPIHIRRELYDQIFNVVNWRGIIERIIQRPGNLFIELGPKQVLTNMIRDIDPSANRINMEDEASLDATIRKIAEHNES